jgi:hypothetical protein
MEKYDGPPKDMGSSGDLPRTVMWILEHEPRNERTTPGRRKVDVDYLGKSEKWPTGCYKVSGEGVETQYLNGRQVIWVAREVLGMTQEDADDRDKQGKKTGGNEWERIMSPGDTAPAATGQSTNRASGQNGPSSPRSSTSSTTKGRRASGKRAGTSAAGIVSTAASPGGPVTRRARTTRPTASRKESDG